MVPASLPAIWIGAMGLPINRNVKRHVTIEGHGFLNPDASILDFDFPNFEVAIALGDPVEQMLAPPRLVAERPPRSGPQECEFF